MVLFYFILSLQLYLQHMEIPRLGVKLELQLQPMPQPQKHQSQGASKIYATA